LALALAVPLIGAGAALGADTSKKPGIKELPSFGTLTAMSADEAKAQAAAWLKSVGKTDAATQQAFAKLWANQDRPVIERVADTFALGNPAVAKLLADVNEQTQAAPMEIPALLKDRQQSPFFRNNLGLVYAKALANRRIYEEALDVFKLIKPERVAEPSVYLFYRAVAEHALTLKDDANRSILRLLDDAVDAPDRYKMPAILMAFEMQSWKEADIPSKLSSIARKMDNAERRLELARGGPKTQKIQKDALARLDEIIKELENQGKGDCNGGCCPGGGKPNGGMGGSPMPDSIIAKNPGKGAITEKDLKAMAAGWGKLPEKERAAAIQQLTRDMPPKFREVIETYFRKIASEDRP
jgi:hypothetical protein